MRELLSDFGRRRSSVLSATLFYPRSHGLMLPFRTAYLLAYRCGYFSQQIAILMPCVLNVLLEKCNLTAPQSNQLPFYGSYTVSHLLDRKSVVEGKSVD